MSAVVKTEDLVMRTRKKSVSKKFMPGFIHPDLEPRKKNLKKDKIIEVIQVYK